MIGAFAVSVDSRTSGSGFAALGRELGRAVGEGKDAERTFWRGELADAVAYWSDKSADGGLADAQFDAIMAELATLRRGVRALAHGGSARRDEPRRMNAEGTPLAGQEKHSVFSYLVNCPYEDCRAKARHRCVGAVSQTDGYPSTIHAGREQAWEALVNGLTAGLTREQAAEVLDRFRKPVTQEVRRAVADTILVPADRH